MKTRALLVTGLHQIECGEITLPDPGPGELLLEASLTVISPGTELRCMAGAQDGSQTHPFIPGYSFLGAVVEKGPGTAMKIGTRVLCSGTQKSDKRHLWGGHVGHAIVREESVFTVPDGLDDRSVALAKIAGISHHGWSMGRAGPGDSVVVLGLGLIGMLSALIHKAHGAQVLALDVLENRRALARSLGLATGDPHDSNVRDLLPAGAEVVVDCTGVPSVAAKAAEWIKELPWGAPVNASRTLLIQGSYDDKGCISLPYFPSFMNELKILVPRDHTSSDTHAILALLASGRLNFAPLLSRIARPEGAAGVYAELREKGTDLLTAAFNWRG